ncbi:hypothetical protein SASPL_152101 [Salvia splendens]|uniref:Uncharacterized protein n=1 Tax=Salvia splendens TaxID=180675 RepID=A0A8X8Z007_SALSN|nr:hypothetical protein SASPL_152101 [Salvia splendens]
MGFGETKLHVISETEDLQFISLCSLEVHPRRLQALKALTYAPSSNSEILSKLYEIVFRILEKVGEPQKRKKGIFGIKGGEKESVIPSNLQYAAIIALRRLPLDPGNPAFLHRAAQGVLFSDPVAVRHSLEILSELASKDLYAVAMALGNVQPGGALHDVLHLRDVLARVALAKLCHTVARARVLDVQNVQTSSLSSILYSINFSCIPVKEFVLKLYFVSWVNWIIRKGTHEYNCNTPSVREMTSDEKDSAPPKTTKDKSAKTRRPQPLIKLVMRRLESSFRSFSRPVLHAVSRVVQEMGKSRAAAFALDINPTAPSEGRRVPPVSSGIGSKDTIASLLASLMEVVRTTVACECVYVRAMVIKALIWMQSPYESFDELEPIIASELSDPSCPATLLNDILLTLHARFKIIKTEGDWLIFLNIIPSGCLFPMRA